MSGRFKFIDSKLVPGIQIYDKVLDKVVIEINTTNQEINRIIGKKAMEVLEGNL